MMEHLQTFIITVTLSSDKFYSSPGDAGGVWMFLTRPGLGERVIVNKGGV